MTHRGESSLRPDLATILDRESWAAWRAIQALARVPGIRPPADPARWLEWANGGATDGDRYEGIVAQELRERWHERRRPVVREVPPLGTVGPWREGWRYGQRSWSRHAIRKGREHVEPLVYIRSGHRQWSAWWSAWKIAGLVAPAEVLTGRTEGEVRAAVDAWLTGARVRLA